VRIAWFTPLSAGTGVARYSVNAVRALSDLVDIEVWAESRDDNLSVGACEVHDLSDPVTAAKMTESCDLRVFNMGNNAWYHEAIYRAYEVSGGLMILHDKRLQNFFSETASPDHYMRLMTYLYGKDGVDGAIGVLANPGLLSDGDFLDRFPLTETCLWNAEGVLTHSLHSAEAVRTRYGALVPVEAVQLPLCLLGEYGDSRPLLTRGELEVPADTCLLVATGRVGRGKRIETVLEALAGSERLRTGCMFVAVGAAEDDYLVELQERVLDLGLESRVRFVTVADDHAMQSYLAAADICVNLRYPSTESSSATLVEQLYHGKPTVVYDIGVYSEQPDDIVVKVQFDQGVEGVRRALVELATDPTLRSSIGERAREYARENCTPSAFARRFRRFAAEVIESRPSVAAIDERASKLGSARSLYELHWKAKALARQLMRDRKHAGC